MKVHPIFVSQLTSEGKICNVIHSLYTCIFRRIQIDIIHSENIIWQDFHMKETGNNITISTCVCAFCIFMQKISAKNSSVNRLRMTIHDRQTKQNKCGFA